MLQGCVIAAVLWTHWIAFTLCIINGPGNTHFIHDLLAENTLNNSGPLGSSNAAVALPTAELG